MDGEGVAANGKGEDEARAVSSAPENSDLIFS